MIYNMTLEQLRKALTQLNEQIDMNIYLKMTNSIYFDSLEHTASRLAYQIAHKERNQ